MKKIYSLSVLFLQFATFSFAQNVELSERLISQFNEGQVKAQSINASTADHLWLSPVLHQVFIHWNDLTAEAQQFFIKYKNRPELEGTEETFGDGNFLFHFTLDGPEGESVDPEDADANGTPDYIDNMASKFGEMFTLYHSNTGLTIPPGDGTNGSNNKYDIYVSGDIAGEGVYGYVSPEDVVGDNPNSTSLTEVNASTSYMVMRNNYYDFGNDPDVSLSVTAAHEYMHATQMGYNSEMDSWFMEACATWSEEFAFPGYNDNFQYLMGLFGKPDIALNLEDGEAPEHDGHWYSSWVFIKYLTEHTDDNIIKNIYEQCIESPATYAINDVLTQNWQKSFFELFTDFIVANVIMSSDQAFEPYTYERASDYEGHITEHGDFKFETNGEPLNYTGANISWDSQSDGNDTLMRLSADYFEFEATANFKIIFTPNPATDEAGLMLIKANLSAPGIEVVYSDINGAVNVTDQADWDLFVPIVVRFDPETTDTDPIDYTLTVTEAGLGINDLSDKSISVFPNPSADVIYINGSLISGCELRISDLLGKTLYRKSLLDKENVIDIECLSMGIYILQVFEKDIQKYVRKITIAD